MRSGRSVAPGVTDRAPAMAWRMVAIAIAWSGFFVLAVMLSAPVAPGEPTAQVPPAEAPMAIVEAPRTRALRHGGSGPAWVVEP